MTRIKAATLSTAGPQPCLICSCQIAGPQRQNHMGRHILWAVNSVAPEGSQLAELPGKVFSQVSIQICILLSFFQVLLDYPCGFCGGSCKVWLKSGKVNSDCSIPYNFMVTPASKPSKDKPLKNVPIYCIMCNDLHWKYNMKVHLNN
jgi:hypothetical protein